MTNIDARYLCRGKQLGTGDWWEGSAAFDGLGDAVICATATIGVGFCNECSNPFGAIIRVDPATVGQCTGLEDKTGRLIFEGDVVRCNSGVFVIKSKRTYNFLYIKDVKNGDWDGLDEFVASKYTDYGRKEIIGNIHDNPELLEGTV